MTDVVGALVERGDLDELTRLADRLAGAAEWDELLRLRDMCRAALARGKQLWPVASNCEYRVALEAPGPWAARVLVERAGHFALGPLAEVAASTHPWSEVAPHLAAEPLASMFAHERVVRGENLSGAGVVSNVLDLPFALCDWEPAYAVAEYGPDEAHFPAPAIPRLEPLDLPSTAPAKHRADPDVERGLLDLVGAWTAESNGRAAVAVVDGPVEGAVRALGAPRADAARVTPATAFSHLAWAGASGGAHGRRRGAAVGRFAAWWAAAALLGALDDWPVATLEVDRLEWHLWDAGEPATGWLLRVAVHDPDTGTSWALAATDAV